ncbi:MAG: enoyl-CoA hydratase/isomerase family protein [Deltaproteobacteria bacterium]|nr:enoyl-CoA hydratase/isomerase family protein [Deltaproteobacteria bacterium]
MAEVEFEVRGHVGYITLNRPDAANALNAEVARQLDQAALLCDENADLRAVLLTGAGRMFCGGGDLKAFAAQPLEQLPAYLKSITLHFHQALHRFARMRAPLVIAVNGNAGGGGMSLALAGDIVLAAESARFTMAYTRIGLTPDGSSTYTLPRLIGLRRAAELMLTNRTLSAREAEQMGLITRTVPDAELRQQAEALVQELVQGATRAFGGVKRLLYSSATASLAEQMELETEWIAEMARTRDAHEGITAFLGKRAPKFSGD